ncbi:MAG: hypothetical protein IKT72_00840, partial [Clostridia bacterium]|nr:hypothetical protein [Clostridia bacterium]
TKFLQVMLENFCCSIFKERPPPPRGEPVYSTTSKMVCQGFFESFFGFFQSFLNLPKPDKKCGKLRDFSP